MEKSHALHLLTELIKKHGEQRHAEALKTLSKKEPEDTNAG